MPRDFREILSRSSELVFEVDRDTARIQWEMMGKFNETGPPEIATCARRSLGAAASDVLQSAAIARRRARHQLRALVVGDPGDPDRGLSLDGARQEALEVMKVLKGGCVVVDALIGAPNVPREGELADIPPATIIDVLRLLSSNTYDILHYAGHADFDPNDPEHAGWIFGQKFFTARELAAVDNVPALVVANACLSGLTSNKRSGGSLRAG